MIEPKYQRKTEKWWKKQKVRTLITLENGWAEIPPRTVCSVTRKYKGLSLISEPCPNCGVKVKISRVPYRDLQLILN